MKTIASLSLSAAKILSTWSAERATPAAVTRAMIPRQVKGSRTHGFVVCEDNLKKAYSALYPTLSFRHKCDTCGRWSAVFGNNKKMECRRCFTGRKPFNPTLQSYKLYLCCLEEDCPIRGLALELLHEAGFDVRWPNRDGFGQYHSLEQIKGWPEDKRIEFLLTLNNISVSKFRARKLVHPGSTGSKARSRLPKKG